MQKVRKKRMTLQQIISLTLDILVLSYIFLYFYWIFGAENTDTHVLTSFFVRINPMTWGTYMLGIAMLVHFITFRNIIGRCLMGVVYCGAVVVSLIAIMGMTYWSDLVIYVPHIIIIILAIVILVQKHRQFETDNNMK